MITVNKIQEDWIADVKKKIDLAVRTPVSFLFYPPEYYGTGAPNVANWYKKPILACVPHKNFPDLSFNCEFCDEGSYQPNGWAGNIRYIHDLHSGVNILQYRYKCDNSRCPKFRNVIQSFTLLDGKKCPEFARQKWSAQAFLTEKSGVTSSALTYILENGMSSKSFEDIQLGFKHFRSHRYLRFASDYYLSVDQYCKSSNGTYSPSSFPCFSAIDENNGYNDLESPTTDYVIDIFQGKF